MTNLGNAELWGATGHDVLEMLVDDITAGLVEVMAPPDVADGHPGSTTAIAMRYTTLGNEESKMLIIVGHELQRNLILSLIRAMDIHLRGDIDLGGLLGDDDA